MDNTKISKIFLYLFLLLVFISLGLGGYYFYEINSNRVVVTNSSNLYTVDFKDSNSKKDFSSLAKKWGVFEKNGVNQWDGKTHLKFTISRLNIVFEDEPQSGGFFVIKHGDPVIASDSFNVNNSTGFLRIFVDQQAFFALSERDREKYLNAKLIDSLYSITNKTLSEVAPDSLTQNLNSAGFSIEKAEFFHFKKI